MIAKLFVTITLSAFYTLAVADVVPANHNNISLSPTEIILTKTQHEANKDAQYTVDVSYPQLSGNNLDASAQQFNQRLADIIANAITQFKMQIVTPNDSSIPDDANKNSLNIDYTIKIIQVNKQKLASIRLNELTYFAGSAHPLHTIDVFNYNLTTGTEIQLTDLFKSDSNYLSFISTYCNKELKTKLEDANNGMIDTGTSADAKSFANWNLRANGLLIIFNEYQVAPYVSGMPEVLIPYSALQQIIAPNSPLVACVKDQTACK